MTGAEYQVKAMRTAKGLSNDQMLMNATLGLSGEAGECADMLKKHMFQGHGFNSKAYLLEIGDILWYVALACEAMGVTLDDVMQMNIDKLNARYPEGFSSDASVNRKE